MIVGTRLFLNRISQHGGSGQGCDGSKRNKSHVALSIYEARIKQPSLAVVAAVPAGTGDIEAAELWR
jgi:hypothetical protein